MRFHWTCCQETEDLPGTVGECQACGKTAEVYGPDAAGALCVPCWKANASDPSGHGQVCDGYDDEKFVTHPWTRSAKCVVSRTVI